MLPRIPQRLIHLWNPNLSGWVKVAFAEPVPVDVGDVRNRLGLAPTTLIERVVSVDIATPAQLLAWHVAAVDQGLTPYLPLYGVWRVWVGMDGSVLTSIGRRAAYVRTRVIRWWRELAPTLPDPVQFSDDPESKKQFHLDPAPMGVGAREAWATAGADGSQVRLADVELGWGTDHEDLQAPWRDIELICHHNMAYAESLDRATRTLAAAHGTRVLGVAVGADNAVGGLGVAPGVPSIGLAGVWQNPPAGWAPSGPLDQVEPNRAIYVEDALIAAMRWAGDGGVTVLEIQRGHIQPLPAEVDPATLSVIQLLTSHKIVVLEAAGNGANDLDAWSSAELEGGPRFGASIRTLDPTDAIGFVDSGAIMVGAIRPHRTGDARSGRRLDSANFGRRIDCVAPAVGLHCADVTLNPMTDALVPRYTRGFGQTSGATAILAGLACSLQGARLGAGGPPIRSRELRALLISNTGQWAGIADIADPPSLPALIAAALGNP